MVKRLPPFFPFPIVFFFYSAGGAFFLGEVGRYLQGERVAPGLHIICVKGQPVGIAGQRGLGGKGRIQNWDEVQKYRDEAAHKSDFERGELNKEKTGVVLKGLNAINPVTKKEIPIWVSDYVLMSYGTGAIMAVPAHDTRDYAFAKAFGLPIVEVVAGGDITKEAYTECEHGRMVNSGFLDGMEVAEAKKAIADYLEKEGIGHRKVNYKLRDWVFARQRYWGEPIPLVKCDKCGWVPLSESELPLELPMLDDFSPTDDGSSCLARAKDWLHTT